MKLTHVIYVCMKMFSMKNGIKTTNILYTESHKSFPIPYGKFLKRVLSYLYCINYNEINICHSESMFPLKNDFNSINILYTGSNKSFRCIAATWRKNLKRILTYLHWAKYNKINLFHKVVEKYVSYTRSLKRFLVHYGLCFKTAGNAFSFVFHRF